MSEASREAFEKWVSSPPYEHEIERFPDSAVWPGQYKKLSVQLAWEAWQESQKQLWKYAEKESNKLRVQFGQTKGHTAGPWTVKRHCDSVTGDPYKTLYESHIAIEPDVCAVWAPPQNKERKANAVLIAAAPDLLAACFATVEYLKTKADSESNDLWGQVSAAIRQAIGFDSTTQQPSNRSDNDADGI